MKEGNRLDRYFARKDTILAKTLRRVSPKVGAEFRRSKIKRVSDVGFALTFALLRSPAAIRALQQVRKEYKGSPIYVQNRVFGPSSVPDQEYEMFPLKKIRTMRDGSDSKEVFGVTMYKKDNDPRLLQAGKHIRSIRLDEYPQLGQILRGEMSFIGIRPTHPYEWEEMRETFGNDFDKWKQGYFEGKPGYITLYRTMGGSRMFRNRYRWDTKYAEEANLGMDLYIYYRALRKLLSRGRR